MPYLVEKDTNLKRVVAEGTDAQGYEFRETESVVHGAGAVVYEQDIAPETLKKLEDGDNDHLNSLVKQISEDEAAKILAERGQTPPVVPEHEAEAEVLHQDGSDVLTREEVVESNPNGDPPVVEEVEVDDSEGRESADPEGVRVTEIDDRRRGEGDAPASSSSGKKTTVKEKRQRAAELEISGRSNMNEDELDEAIAAAESSQDQEQEDVPAGDASPDQS